MHLAAPCRALVAALALVAFGIAFPAAARGDDDVLTVTMNDPQPVTEMLQAFTRLTGTPILWSANDQMIMSKRITGMKEIRAPKGKLFETVRALLAMQEVVLVPLGAEPHVLYVAMDARSVVNQLLLRMKPRFVDVNDENVASLDSLDGDFVTAMVSVRHLENLRDARAVLQRLVTQNNIGNLQELPAARALLVTDFAPNVAAVYRTLRRMDVPPPTRLGRAEFFELRHAKCMNVARVLEELLGDRRPAAPVAPGASPAETGVPAPVETRFSADPDTNTVVVVAAEDRIEAMRKIVEKLDREPAAGATPKAPEGK